MGSNPIQGMGVRVVLCVGNEQADHSSKESYHLCKKNYGTEEEARAQ
jgi:hypothetical protein